MLFRSKVIIYGGTYNGMELSNSFYYFDYVSEEFNIIRISSFPEERVEPSVMYSSSMGKLYIISGGKPEKRNYVNYKNILALDFNMLNDLLLN